jgi:hypothetical protein
VSGSDEGIVVPFSALWSVQKDAVENRGSEDRSADSTPSSRCCPLAAALEAAGGSRGAGRIRCTSLKTHWFNLPGSGRILCPRDHGASIVAGSFCFRRKDPEPIAGWVLNTLEAAGHAIEWERR